jgi:hypothetical protein
MKNKILRKFKYLELSIFEKNCRKRAETASWGPTKLFVLEIKGKVA